MTANWQRPRDARGHFIKAPPRPLIEVLFEAEAAMEQVDADLMDLHIREAPRPVDGGAVPDRVLFTDVYAHDDDGGSVPTWLWCALAFAAGWCVAMLVNLGWSR